MALEIKESEQSMSSTQEKPILYGCHCVSDDSRYIHTRVWLNPSGRRVVVTHVFDREDQCKTVNRECYNMGPVLEYLGTVDAYPIKQ